jgi:hypothetical protein
MAAVLAALMTLGGVASASATIRLRLSEAGKPVPVGSEVYFTGLLSPQGSSGHVEFGGAGPLKSNNSALDKVQATAGGAGQGGGWRLRGQVDSVALSSTGHATIITSKLAIAKEPGPPPPPPPGGVGTAAAEPECWFPLPQKITGTFPTSGKAVVSGTAKAAASSACKLAGFRVGFTLELQSPRLTGFPVLETSLLG